MWSPGRRRRTRVTGPRTIHYTCTLLLLFGPHANYYNLGCSNWSGVSYTMIVNWGPTNTHSKWPGSLFTIINCRRGYRVQGGWSTIAHRIEIEISLDKAKKRKLTAYMNIFQCRIKRREKNNLLGLQSIRRTTPSRLPFRSRWFPKFSQNERIGPIIRPAYSHKTTTKRTKIRNAKSAPRPLASETYGLTPDVSIPIWFSCHVKNI